MPTSKNDREFADIIKSEIAVPIDALDTVISWIEKNLDPDDVFSRTELEEWAENNGYSKD